MTDEKKIVSIASRRSKKTDKNKTVDKLQRDGLVVDGMEIKIPAPTNPMGVARHLVKELYTVDSKLVLRTHRNDLFKYDDTCWPEAEASGVKGALYKYLEKCFYMKVTKDSVEPTPWEPTRHKIGDVLEALKAITYLNGLTEPPSWVEDEGVTGLGGFETYPPQEIVAMRNGLLYIPDRTLLAHTPNYFAHNALPFEFDSEAPYPERWHQFMKELWKDDKDAISTLQEIFGYIIGGSTQQQKMFLLIGPKRSGKGTIARVLRGLMGHHNVSAPTLASLSGNFGLQPLIGHPLALVADARLGTRVDSGIVVERLLSISGEDALTADRKYREPWTGKFPTRFVILTNELPRLQDSSGALASRFIMLVFTRTWYDQENPTLTEELLAEAPGIFNWALEGLDRLTERGRFKPPKSSEDAIRQLEDLASPMSTFLRERCEFDVGASVGVADLWGAWKEWCEESNQRLGTKATFGRDLRSASPLIRKTRLWEDDKGKRSHEYVGIRLLPLNKQFAVTVTGMTEGAEDGGRHSSHGNPQLEFGEEDDPSHGSHGDWPMFSEVGETELGEEPAPFDPGEDVCKICGTVTFEVDAGGRLLCRRHIEETS